jgi:hypothetical protein
MLANTLGNNKELQFLDDEEVAKHTEVINHDGRKVGAYEFTIPFVSRNIRRRSDDGVLWVHYWTKYEIDQEINIPETWQDAYGFTDNLGNNLAKLWQGVIVEANTFGEDKQLEFYDDQGVLRHTEIINFDGRKSKAIPFQTPFISSSVRVASDDAVLWGFYKIQYIADVEPESASVWEGEFNTHDLSGLILMQRMAVAYRSTDDAILKLTFEDGTTQEHTLPNSAGEFTKVFFYTPAKKWRACKYRIDTDGEIRPYRRHCEVWMKSFNSSQPFVRFTPFGGDSNVTDIRI